MVYNIKQQFVSSTGVPYANYPVQVTRDGLTTPLRLYGASGSLLSDAGLTVTDANGNVNIYVGENIPVQLTLLSTGPKRNVLGILRGNQPGGAGLQPADQRTFELRIDTAANQVYGVTMFAPFSGIITQTVTKSLAGACAGTVGINGVLIGTADAVTTAITAVAQTTNNKFVTGQPITYTVGASPTATGVNVTLVVTRTGN